jgi:hypothetical protein
LPELAADARACRAIAARGSLRAMARAAAVACALALLGCGGEDYVIGRYADGGVGECAGRTGAVVCSGFEQAELSDWSETEVVQAGAIERSTQRAHAGSASLHASSSASMSEAVVAASFPALRAGTLYLRAYLYVPADVPTETINIFFVGDSPTPDPFSGIDFNLEDGAVQIYSPESAVQRQTGTLQIPRDRWFCFRARIAIDEAAGRVDAYIDDELALRAEELDTLPAAGVHLFRAGLDWSSEQDAFFELYLDDVVVDTHPIACL